VRSRTIAGMATSTELPPGPRAPAVVQTLGWLLRPNPYMSRCWRKYGSTFFLRILTQPPIVVLSDPDDVRALFTAPPDVIHVGEGSAYALGHVLGNHSVITLDEDAHLVQRRLMLPAFHGERVEQLAGLIEALAEQTVTRLPRDEPFAVHPYLQRLTMDIILTAVFGLAEGKRMAQLREHLEQLLAFAEKPIVMLPATRDMRTLRWLWGPIKRTQDAADEAIYAAIADRRRNPDGGAAGRADLLSTLLEARHEDGSPMSDVEIRDELITMIIAGHETTASQLAWGLLLLAGAPDVRARLHADPDDDTYLQAVIHEMLRHRVSTPTPAARIVKEPVDIGGRTYAPGTMLVANGHLMHHDPAIYPDPEHFRPERFLDSKPGTYSFIAFGGGRRRCIGSALANLEMKIVLRALLRACDVLPASRELERGMRRSITSSPAGGAVIRVADRAPNRQAVAA
jgi:hypothetical protein